MPFVAFIGRAVSFDASNIKHIGHTSNIINLRHIARLGDTARRTKPYA